MESDVGIFLWRVMLEFSVESDVKIFMWRMMLEYFCGE